MNNQIKDYKKRILIIILVSIQDDQKIQKSDSKFHSFLYLCKIFHTMKINAISINL